MGADAVKDIVEVAEGGDVESFVCGGEAGDDRCTSPCISLMKNSPGPRPNGEAGKRPIRHFSQCGLDTASGSGIMNAGQRDTRVSEKANKRFLETKTNENKSEMFPRLAT